MIRNDREYRCFIPLKPERREEGEEPSYIVEGYASTFEPYVLFEEEGIQYNECIDPKAFDGCDMSDVVFLKDHTGTVMARTKNQTVQLMVDSHGLKTRVDLSKSKCAREMYEEIGNGLYDQMSFAFTVEEDSYDRATHTRTILKFRKIYDVSAVGFPANPGTEIGVSARSILDGAIQEERAERLAEEKRQETKKRIEMKIRLMNMR